MLINFDGKNVLVTGGSRGIGKEIALAFLSSGECRVTITGKGSKTPGWMDDNEFKSRVEYYQLDLSSKDWSADFEAMVESKGGFDVCVNNAGINSIHHLSEFPQSKVQEILAVNLEAPIVISGIVSKQMALKKYGRIINISSIFGVVSKEKRSAYTASKSGLIGVTKAMALDLAKYNVLVNSISPGFIATDLTREVLGGAGIEEMQSRVPLKRLGQPEEIANYVLFLSCELNSYMTGQNIVVDGGFISE